MAFGESSHEWKGDFGRVIIRLLQCFDGVGQQEFGLEVSVMSGQAAAA